MFTDAAGRRHQPVAAAEIGDSIDRPAVPRRRPHLGWKTPDILGWFEQKHWFLIGDIAAVVRGAGRDVSCATLIVLALVPLTAWVLWRTRFGLRLRSRRAKRRTRRRASASTSPACATRRMAVSGGLAGLGGATWRSWPPTYYRQGQTGGQGFIGLATHHLRQLATVRRAAGALLFGFATALRLRDVKNVPALFLVMAIALIVVGILALRKRHVVAGLISVGCAILAIVGFVTIDEIPQSLTFITPHVLTLIVLATATQRLRPPAWYGKPFRAGESH